MPKYLFEATYVGQGVKGLMEEGGTKRRDALTEALKSVGGTLESFYYAFGYYDVLDVLRRQTMRVPQHCHTVLPGAGTVGEFGTLASGRRRRKFTTATAGSDQGLRKRPGD